MSRLLFEGRAHLPEEYPTPTGMIIGEPEQQPSSLSPGLSHEPPPKPSLLPKAEDFSDNLSSGPTPAPTPEVQHRARDPSDGSSSSDASEPRSPRGDKFDDVGAGEERNSAAVNTSAVHLASGSNDEGPRVRTAAAVSPAATGSREDQDLGGLGEGEESSQGEADKEGAPGEREEKESERAQHGGARERKTGYSRDEFKAPRSLAVDLNPKQNETREEEEEDYHDRGGVDREGGEYGQRRKDESKADPLSTSPKSLVAATASTTTVNEEPDLGKSPGESVFGENGANKEKPERGEEGGEEERKEEQVPEIEDEEEVDDDIPEDVESEEMYAEHKDGRGRTDDGNEDEQRSDADGSKKGADDKDAEKDADPFTSGGDIGVAVGRTGGAVNSEDNVEDNERASPRVVAREETGGLGISAPPPVSSPLLRPSPMPISPTAAGSTLLSEGVSEGPISPSLSPRLAPSRGLAPAPSSPEAGVGGGGGGESPLSGLPLPPMGGARQRFGLLGSLPPVGGRGLPSLALPVGTKVVNVREEGEGGGVGRVGGGEAEEDAKEATGTTDAIRSSGASPLLSPRFTAARSSIVAEKKGPGGSSEPLRPSTTAAGGAQKRAVDSDTTDKDGVSNSSDGLDELTRHTTTRGKEEEQDKKKEEAALRVRLGFGLDEDEEEDEEQDDKGDGQHDGEGGGDEISPGDRKNNVSSSPGSPRQHQGQEEEHAGRILPSNPRGEDDEGAPSGGLAGGDYFGDSNEASSVDEDMSFEQESIDGDGGGDGTGSDDYFS